MNFCFLVLFAYFNDVRLGLDPYLLSGTGLHPGVPSSPQHTGPSHFEEYRQHFAYNTPKEDNILQKD